MAHAAQKEFFNKVKAKYPKYFSNVRVVDCGSLDVNGSLKDLFTGSYYLGVDIVEGKNVDKVSAIKDLPYDNLFDTVISGEMLEHDESWADSLRKMYAMGKNEALIAISAAGEGRREHGTRRTTGSSIWGTSPDYYQNITEDMIKEVYIEDMFSEWYFEYNPDAKDIYFYGIKI